MDLTSVSSPHRITAANNRIVSLTGVPESVNFLDLSGNIAVDAQTISCARSMFICILKNTQVLNVSQLSRCTSLLYLDLESCGMAGMDLDFLHNCNKLLYLNISYNLYTKVPSLPTIMLRELDLSYNDIT